MSDSRVYVGGLPNAIEERDLKKFFDGYGKLNEVLIRSGFAFVQFDNSRDAEDAIYYLNKRKLLGRRITLDKARGKTRGRDLWPSSRKIDRTQGKYGAPIRTEYKVLVKNLSSRVSWQDLKDYMREAGEVTYGEAHKPYKNKGLVEFATYDDMKAVIRKLDGALFKGEKIRLIEAMKFRRDRYDHSRSRSRSRCRNSERKYKSRSHSRSIEGGEITARSPRSRSHSRSAEKNRKSFKSRSRSESNSPHRKSRFPNRGPRTPPAELKPHGSSDSPRGGYESSSRSRSHRDDASVDRQITRSHSRSNSPHSRCGSPKRSWKCSRSETPSEIPVKRFK